MAALSAPGRWLRGLVATPVDEGAVAAAPSVGVREIFRRFWPDARPYRKMIALGLLLAAIVPVIEAAEIWLFKLIVDDVLVPRDLGPLAWIAAIAVGLVLVGGALRFADDYIAAWIGERFLLSLRTRLFGHLQAGAPDALDGRRSGDIVTRLTGDVETIEALVLTGISEVLSAVVRIVLFAGILFYLSWQLAIVSLLVAPLFWIVARRVARMLKRAARAERRRSGSLAAVAEQSLANLTLVQAYQREEDELARFRDESRGVMSAELAAVRIRGVFAPIVDLLQLMAVMTVVGVGTWAVSEGQLTIGGLLVFLAYVGRMYSPVRELGSLSNTIFEAAAGAERVIELLDEPPRVTDRPDAARLGRVGGLLELDAVSYSYPGAVRPALRDVTLRIEPGEIVALVGASGAGKTTLARLLMRLDDPAGGGVRVDGHDLRKVRLDSLRANIAYLPQDAALLHGTIRENIAFGRPGASESEIVAAARAAGAHDFVMAGPEGYDAVVGERGRRLSGGQRQRVAIARALVRDAPILLLDEPSTGLDAEARCELLDPLRALMRGRTTVIVSHDLFTVREADRIIVLEDGRVIEDGHHVELLGRDGAYARLFRERPVAAPAP